MSTQSTSSPWKTLVGLPENVWRSIFRNPLPSSDLGRASTSFTNFFLHLHPVKVHRNSLKATYTLGLGLISFFLFFILAFAINNKFSIQKSVIFCLIMNLFLRVQKRL